MVTWTMGANRTVAEAAEEGELPALFGQKLNIQDSSPFGAYLITGVVSTLVLVIYGFMAGTNEELFWTLFAFSSMIFLMPYLALFPAFLKLRRIDGHLERPYRVPGSKAFLTVLAVLCELFIIQAIVFFVWVPGQPIDWAYAVPVLVGVALTLGVGELLIRVPKSN
jgi:amino acid transporter